MTEFVRVLIEYGNGDSCYGSAKVFRNEYKAFKARRDGVKDYLHPTFYNYSYALKEGEEAANRYANDCVDEVLMKAERGDNYEYEEEGDYNIYYNPNEMSFSFTDFENDCYGSIKVQKQTIE